MRLDNKVALVTGAASGFGQGIAETFAREGARVAVVDINEKAARQAAASISNKAIAARCDVSQRADVDTAVRATVDAFEARPVVTPGEVDRFTKQADQSQPCQRKYSAIRPRTTATPRTAAPAHTASWDGRIRPASTRNQPTGIKKAAGTRQPFERMRIPPLDGRA